MSTLAQRISEAMRRNPALRPADIARACKVKQPSVTGWMKGDTKTLKAETARLAAQLFGCDQNWLATGVGSPRWREREAANDPDTPEISGEAQPLSLDAITVDPELPWEAVTSTQDLPPTFRLAAPDDALAPVIPRGTMLMMARYAGEPLEPEDGILVRTSDGHVYLRMYAQGVGDAWRADALSKGYVSLDSLANGLTVLAVMTGQIRVGRKVR